MDDQQTQGRPAVNRLARENSPYLLQHADNPVDWYPWGQEALQRARREDKAIFLSVGYSTCHWCHVMERESFEREDVAAILNEHFVAIKVDREERPDVDQTYMAATQVMTGRGGWPNSVWLTPDGRPWFAGTYFPREDQGERPGFKSVLKALAEMWRTRRGDVEAQADQITEAVKRTAAARVGPKQGDILEDPVAGALQQLRASFDSEHGGFGSAPRFPPHASLRLLLHQARHTDDRGLLAMAAATLRAMGLGGVRDHLAGGFHRYSTDERWFLPHFEKMLYDNAQLVRAYVEAHLLTHEHEYARVAVETCEWVLREMRDGPGGFYSALDADSEGEEGKFYLWRRDEILETLGRQEGDLFCRVYNVEAEGNYREEATGHQPGTNILYLGRSIGDIAREVSLTAVELRRRLKAARTKLLQRRARRVRPHRDDKVLTAWNGLMIGSLAYAGHHLREPRYVEAARQAADFILTAMRRNGRLLRSYRVGSARLNAYLDDYAFLADGLLELHEATGQKRYLTEARALTDVLLDHYYDDESGGFFFTADDHGDMLLRSKSPFDSALPSGNGVAARVLVRLAELPDGGRYRSAAEGTVEHFAGLMRSAPHASESLILAAALLAKDRRERAEPPVEPVAIQAVPARLEAAPGETVHVEIVLRMGSGWHVNSHEPRQAYLVPTSIALADNPRARLGRVAYPDGKEMRLAFSPEPMSVYEGEVGIRAAVTVPPAAKAGSTALQLRAAVQACSNAECLAPQVLEARVPLRIIPES